MTTPQPSSPEIQAVLRDAYAALRSGKPDRAAQAGSQLVAQYPQESQCWHLLGMSELARSNSEQAVEALKQALSLAPDQALYCLDYARCCLAAGWRNDALDSLDRAGQLNPEESWLLNSIGIMYGLCENQEKSLPYLERAAQAEPRPEYLYNLAAAQRMVGDISGAEDSCDRVIALNPKACRAHFIRSNLRICTTDDNHIEEIEKLLEDGKINWRGSALLHYSVGKEYEDLRNYRSAFAHFHEGGQLKRKNTRYDVDKDINVINRIIETSRTPIEGKGTPSNEPIFIMGLPRSGTTLVERIIGSHRDVVALGELSIFGLELQERIIKGTHEKLNQLDLIDRAQDVDFKGLGEAYLSKARLRNMEQPRFIDKMPMNYLYCGLIHAALPYSKMIILRRHPVASCYSMFKMNFDGAYPFSYDQNDLGRYYVAFDKIVEHWKGLLGNNIFEVSYEELIADPENQTRRMLAYCDLDWDDACLDFHNNQAASSTASAVQVRQPIYNSSVDLWRNLEDELQPLIEVLKKSGISL